MSHENLLPSALPDHKTLHAAAKEIRDYRAHQRNRPLTAGEAAALVGRPVYVDSERLVGLVASVTLDARANDPSVHIHGSSPRSRDALAVDVYALLFDESGDYAGLVPLHLPAAS